MFLRYTISASSLVALISMLPFILATCYYPNGDIAPASDDPSEVPCPNSKACCPEDAFCLSNGLCWTAKNFLLRGACSDQTWQSPDCPSYCRDARPDSSKVMTPCNFYGQFACDYDICSKGTFTVSPAKVVLRDDQKTSLAVSMTVTVNATTGGFASIPTTTSPTTTSSPYALATENSNCVNSSFRNLSSNQSSKLAGVGAGIGVPFAIALAAALALLGRERRNASRLELELARLRGGCGSSSSRGPDMIEYGGPMAHYQQSTSRRHPQGGAMGNAELTDERGAHEVMAESIAHELQTHRG